MRAKYFAGKESPLLNEPIFVEINIFKCIGINTRRHLYQYLNLKCFQIILMFIFGF